MFEARFGTATLFKRIVESTKELVKEANIDVNSTGLSINSMDSSHVSLIVLDLKREAFEHFRCDAKMTLGLNFEFLAKIFKAVPNDNSLTIKAQKGEDNILFIWESPSQLQISTFELKLMEIDVERMSIPDTDYTIKVNMPSSLFARDCKDMSPMGQIAKITGSKGSVKFSVVSLMTLGSIVHSDSAHSELEDDEKIVIQAEEGLTLTFALDYLCKFAKAAPLSQRLTLSMAPDVPLCIQYNLQQQDEQQDQNIGSLRFFLAPKIEEEEEEPKPKPAPVPVPVPAPAPQSTSHKRKRRLLQEEQEEDAQQLDTESDF